MIPHLHSCQDGVRGHGLSEGPDSDWLAWGHSVIPPRQYWERDGRDLVPPSPQARFRATLASPEEVVGLQALDHGIDRWFEHSTAAAEGLLTSLFGGLLQPLPILVPLWSPGPHKTWPLGRRITPPSHLDDDDENDEDAVDGVESAAAELFAVAQFGAAMYLHSSFDWQAPVPPPLRAELEARRQEYLDNEDPEYLEMNPDLGDTPWTVVATAGEALGDLVDRWLFRLAGAVDERVLCFPADVAALLETRVGWTAS